MNTLDAAVETVIKAYENDVNCREDVPFKTLAAVIAVKALWEAGFDVTSAQPQPTPHDESCPECGGTGNAGELGMVPCEGPVDPPNSSVQRPSSLSTASTFTEEGSDA